MTTVLEICVEGPAGARAALAGGADRVELCVGLALGGLSPSAGLIAATVAVGLPVHVLLRPAAGDFVYDDELADVVGQDIRACAALGAAGVVVGALTRERTLDLAGLARWRDDARDLAMTLHRAIDLCASPTQEAERAAAIGIDRLLTSGAAATAMAGRTVIAAMVAALAGSRTEVMAGSDVTPDNVGTLIATTGVAAVHASASVGEPWADGRIATFGFGAATARRTEARTVSALRAAIAAGPRRL